MPMVVVKVWGTDIDVSRMRPTTMLVVGLSSRHVVANETSECPVIKGIQTDGASGGRGVVA